MLRSFIQADVYRIMLGCESREILLQAIRDHEIDHDGKVRAMRRDDGYEMSITVVFLDGDMLQMLALRTDVQVMQIDNVSARLRALPPMPIPGSRVASGQRIYRDAV